MENSGFWGNPQDMLTHLRLAVGTEVEGLVPLGCPGVIDCPGSQSTSRSRRQVQGHVEVRLGNCRSIQYDVVLDRVGKMQCNQYITS